MISPENARRLAELGIKPYWQICGLDKFVLLNAVDGDMIFPLSQLLEEVEKRGYNWHLWYSDPSKRRQENKAYCCSPFVWELDENGVYRQHFMVGADSHKFPEDAVALALISILENLEETNND